MKPKVTYDFSKLDKFAKSVSKDYRVKVGILGKHDARRAVGASNATIGLVHEFGSFKQKIPMRSFLRMHLAFKANKILLAMVKPTLKLLAKGDYKQIFVILGLKCEEIIQEAFVTSGWGSWVPNKMKTIIAKTPKKLRAKFARMGKALIGKPLIDTSQLRKSITSRVEEIK